MIEVETLRKEYENLKQEIFCFYETIDKLEKELLDERNTTTQASEKVVKDLEKITSISKNRYSILKKLDEIEAYFVFFNKLTQLQEKIKEVTEILRSISEKNDQLLDRMRSLCLLCRFGLSSANIGEEKA